ncbi:DUF2306 domain-containing protein [Confluentibacter flavum]|uniref:DUF2306 domain-containing protein n=1 Tax=Confluentibacter flavum TaxID=1909700 RepID=A0A2N3HH14_9FLAO|nr:DUF2306 domain-containing protein [Confluentibacter flavum]PKQ44260.1 hypothetical protein CSW08_14260 [Confluentibacter flavum]
MKTISIIKITKPPSYLKIAIWTFLILLAGKFIIKDALPYYGFTKEAFGRYWDFKWALIGHISGGIIALVIGPFQFWKTFRNKYLIVHRWMGKTYLIAILMATISSTYLAWTSGIRINFSWALSLQVLAFAWFTTVTMAYISIRRKRVQQHKEWMIRSYVVTFAFVTFRWLVDLPLVVGLMENFGERGPAIIWLSWTIPLLITEVVLNWNKK